MRDLRGALLFVVRKPAAHNNKAPAFSELACVLVEVPVPTRAWACSPPSFAAPNGSGCWVAAARWPYPASQPDRQTTSQPTNNAAPLHNAPPDGGWLLIAQPTPPSTHRQLHVPTAGVPLLPRSLPVRDGQCRCTAAANPRNKLRH